MIAIFKPGKGAYGNGNKVVTANDILLINGGSSSANGSGGLQDDTKITLQANTPYKYTLPTNSKLYGLELQSNGTITVGTTQTADDLGEFEGLTGEVLNFHLLNKTEVWITSPTNIELIPIIYRRSGSGT